MVVASVSDPSVSEMATARGTPEAVYTAAAAERTLTSRHHLTTDLRQHGVEVIDADPTHLPPALADPYLSLKAAGRL